MLAVCHASWMLLLLQLPCSRVVRIKTTFLKVQLLDTGSLTGGMTSWDTPAMPSQPGPGTRPPASTPRPNPQPASQPSWQNSKPIAAVRDAPSSAGPSDPFAGLPPTQAAKPSQQGGANDLLSVSLFDGLSSGKPSTPPPPQPAGSVTFPCFCSLWLLQKIAMASHAKYSACLRLLSDCVCPS